MSRLLKIIRILSEISLKTLYFNFRYLPFRQAVRLPVFVSRHVYLMQMKGTIVIEAPVTTRLIQIGYKGVGIFDHKRSRSIWQVSGTVVFKGKAFIGHGSKISVGPGANLILGQGFVITAESAVVAFEKTIEFGSQCLLSWDSLVMDSDFHAIYNQNNEQINQSENISVGNHVWIGCRCLVLKGSVIPDNSVIAANSLVNKPLDGENRIFGGQPARELAGGVHWSR